MVQEVTDQTFQGFVSGNKMVVVDCWAAWCGPCRFLSPIVGELAEENKDIAFGKLNVDSNNAIPMKYGVMSIPTLLYFKDGEMVDKTIGALPKRALQERLENLKA